MPNYKLEAVARIPRESGHPRFLTVGEVQFNNLTYNVGINRVGALQGSVNPDTLDEDIKTRLRDLLRFPTEFWLYRDSEVVFQGPLTNGQLQSGTFVFYIHSFLYYIRYMYITHDLRYRGVDQFTIVGRLINHWQAQEYGHFSIGTGGNGLSGVERDREYIAAENPQTYTKIEELSEVVNGFEFCADHADRRIELGHPQLGEDKSDLVIFDRRNISNSDIQMSVQVDDIASDAYGTGTSRTADGEDRIVRSHQVNEEVKKLYGKIGVAGTFDGVSRQSTADKHTQSLLTDKDAVLFTPGPGLRPVAGVDVDDFHVGDKITYSFDAGLGLQTVQRRVTDKSVSVNTNDIESISVELS